MPSRCRRLAASVIVLALTALGLVVVTPAVAAAPTASLSVNKLVDGQNTDAVTPGGEFTYTIAVGCDDNDCVSAQLQDPLPAAFAGFSILATSVNPSAQPSSFAYTGCTTTVTASCVLGVDFRQDLGGGLVGITAGGTYTVSVTLKAPVNLPPTWPSNGVAVRNTATATATTANPASDFADVTVTIPITVDAAVGKTWTPGNQQFAPGTASTITLTSQNTSNVNASTLVVQDPSAATDGAAALTAANPFSIVDFTGFGAVTLPAGASTVQVDAYVLDPVSITYKWVIGQPRAPADIQLPGGVTDPDVAGLRFTYAGAAITPSGAAGSVALIVAQRSTNRITGASLVSGASLTNQVAATVTVPGQPPVTKTATAPYTIGPLTVSVQAAKTITPARIPAGTTATAVITGKNTSNGPLTELSVADTDYFTATVQFGGFSAPIAYPNGATAATITWHFSDGSTVVRAVANGSTPVAPAAPVGAFLTGFTLDYTGLIATGASATAQFGISPTGTGLTPATSPASANDTVHVAGQNVAGSATDAATAPLMIFYPNIALTFAKTISPTAPVAPGGTVVAQLPTTTSTDSAFVKPTKIVVEDLYRPGTANDFWNAFNPIAIAPTQVLAGSTLTIDYSTDDGVSWQTFTVVDATAGTKVFSGNLPAALTASITGLRYTFANPAGFAQGTTVSPNAVYQARSTLRSGGAPTSVPDAGPSPYENLGSAQAEGAVNGVPDVSSPTLTDTADAAIETHSGAGTLIASKSWTTPDFAGDLTLLSSQSAALAGTVLGWGVNSTGYTSLTVSDPATVQADASQTVFQAFDLKAIAARSFAQDPLLQWDTVTSVQLVENGVLTTVAAPAGGWMNGSGFVGHTLTGAESAATTGVQLTVVPNDAARAASTNPLAPPVGSGIATSNTARNVDLLWQLRNTVRVPGANPSPWVTATHGYNSADPASVVNTVAVAGVQNGAPVGPGVASDTVSLIDQPPAVDVAKSSSKATIVVPHPGNVPPANYPTDDFTVTATNTSSSRASYVRATDPMPCDSGTIATCLSTANAWAANPYATATYVPASNPFERLTLTGITFTVDTSQVDPAASQVTLWHRSAAGVLSTTQLSLSAAQTLAASDLADVIGVSVVYQGTNPAVNGGSIASGTSLQMVLHTQVRETLRSDPATFVTPFQVDNFAFAQSYDPVLFPTGQQSTPSDSANAQVTLTSGELGVTASKTITPPALIEANRTTPVTVTLAATPASATVATNSVTITDTDPGFWNSFQLTGLSAADVTLPAGADEVRVDVQLNGSSTWQLGTTGPTAVLPSVTLADITGIRFVFDRADQDVFSHTAIPASFTAKAVLHVQLLNTVRGSTTPIPFPSTVTHTVQTNSHRFDVPEIYPDANNQATAGIALNPGTFTMDVSKAPQGDIHTVAPGDPNTWTMTFTNTGTGFLTVNDLVDQLPTSLAWDGQRPTFATSAGGLLSTTVTTAFDSTAQKLTFTWPAGGNRMAPGETFTITLGIVLQPGLSGSQRATNQFIVDTAQTLAACTNLSGNGQGTLAGLTATQCGTSNFVQPTPGPSLLTTKGVKGDVVDHVVSGATNPVNPKGPCLTDAQGYVRSPCAANTIVGGTDEWKLQAVNSGTVPYRTLTLVDPLPFPGDRLLATGSSRGSTYRPTFDQGFGLNFTAPAGTTITWQVTTAANVCLGIGATPAWPTDPTCSTHPAASQWTDSTAFTGDWTAVTGLRAVLDFTTTPGGVLAPGASVSVLYRTVNTPATATATDRAPVTLPVTNAFAWNQFGALATLTSGNPISRAPVKAGVTLTSGTLQVDKMVTGPAAAFAPAAFQADVACTIAGVPIDLGASAALRLNAANSFSAQVSGIPLNADCTVVEHGQAGDYGEFSRTVTPGTVHITQPGLPVDPSQIVTITNDYQFGSMSLNKQANTAAIVPGGVSTYTLTAANTGKLTATNVAVTDTLPAGATVVAISSGGVDANGVITWTIPTFAPGATASFQVVLQFNSVGTFVNLGGITTPSGAWQPPTIIDPCASTTGKACAAVLVTPAAADTVTPPDLANTGTAVIGLARTALLALLAGLGLCLLARRRRAN